jgi:hypothetical protein
MKSTILAALALLLVARPGVAGPFFFDNFNSENGAVETLNYNSFANFQITNGTVDLIGTGGVYDFLPGNGLYVDLDGSRFDAGLQTANPLALAAGNYVLSFDMAGSQRGSTETVNINVFGGLSASYTSLVLSLMSTDPFVSFAVPFSIGSADSVQFSFANTGSDNIGLLLDNVSLDTAAVPEPSTFALIGLGGLAVAAYEYRRRRRSIR